VTLIIGLVQLTGGYSLFSGGVYGRTVGIFAATLGAIEALLAIGGSYPFWSLGIFALCLIVLHGLIVYGEPLER
jgi:Gpi18-like mannosyltransferase